MQPKSKRTRVLTGPQSKSGCFTCKSGKVKCDETKPECQRCMTSSLFCEGYGWSPRRSPEYTQASEHVQGASVAATRLLILDSNSCYADLQHRLLAELCPQDHHYVGGNALKRVLSSQPVVKPSVLLALNALELLARVNQSTQSRMDTTTLRFDITEMYGQLCDYYQQN